MSTKSFPRVASRLGSGPTDRSRGRRMPGRSWVTAFALVTAAALTAPARADDHAPVPRAFRVGTCSRSAGSNPVSVKLYLKIVGLGPPGCDVEVRPGHPGCEFSPVKAHVDASGWAAVTLDDVRSLIADRDCTFAITIREPGQPQRTVHRGMQLAGRALAVPQHMTCYLRSPSKCARANEASTKLSQTRSR
jgi:hypothetical protein